MPVPRLGNTPEGGDGAPITARRVQRETQKAGAPGAVAGFAPNDPNAPVAPSLVPDKHNKHRNKCREIQS